MPESAESKRSGSPRTSRRRNYQACLECKKQKVKCRLGDSETPQPPCSRCRRARLECVFGPARRLRTRAGRPLVSPSAEYGAATSAEREHPPVQHDRDGADSANVREAYGPSATYVRHEQADTGHTTPLPHDLSVWASFPMCRDGFISAREAHHLASHFFQWHHPFFPLVDDKYISPVGWADLVAEESLLCATILTVAARYTWYLAPASSSRAVEMHGMMYRHVQSDIQSFLWSSSPPSNRRSTVLGVIESLMLLAEWHPRPLDVVPPPSEMPGRYPLESFGFESETAKHTMEAEARKGYESFKSLNLTSWRLLGPATNLADEMGLHQTVTQSKENGFRHDSNKARRARVRDLLVTLVFGKTIPLGRKCLLKHPTGPSRSIGTGRFDALLDSWSELYRLVRLIDNTLYPSTEVTAEIISSERYASIVDDFSTLLASWRTQFEQRVSGSTTFAKYIDVVAHSSRSWLHCVAIQSFIRRCRISTRNSGNGDNYPTNALQDSIKSESSRRDLEMIDEMVKESKRTLGIVLELHREGALRHAPLNIMTNIASTSMVLLAVQRLPLRTANGSLSLLNEVANALEEASTDDTHAISHYVTCIKRLIRYAEMEAVDNQSIFNGVNQALDPGVTTLGTDTDTLYAFEGLDPTLMSMPAVPFCPFFDDQSMFPFADDGHIPWMEL